MIKEIEVGGVKHSITLADDMVGSGLKKDPSGKVSVDAGTGLYLDEGRLVVSASGLLYDESFMANFSRGLAGSGLVASGGRLCVSSGIGSVDAGSLAGSGLRTIEDNKLALSLSGSNLLKFGEGGTLDINLNQLSGSGLKANGQELAIDNEYVAKNIIASGAGLVASSEGLRVNAGSGLSIEYNVLAIDYTSLFNPDSFRIINTLPTSVGVKVASGLEIEPSNGVKVKFASRSSGLRLFINENGELDVTQD